MYTAVLDATPRRVAEIAACRLVSMFMLEKLYILHFTSSSIPLYNHSTFVVLARLLRIDTDCCSFISVEHRAAALERDRTRPKSRKERITRT
jgi:hypothetical protein